MSLTPVIDLLQRRFGLNPEALARSSLRAAVAGRLRALGLRHAAGYADLLTRDPEELAALVDAVVVPETWFLRGGGLFAYLAGHVAQALRSRPAGQPFRALSAPCSTGEEPYSLALALRDAGVPAAACTVVGVDLSRRNLDAARRGSYSEFSFRQTDPELRTRHFRREGDRWVLREDVRSAVQFREANLLDPLVLADEPPFDLVLCRNLFIYLLPEARRQLLATLERLLAPDGLLGTGYAEPLEVLAPHFRRGGPEGLFLYRLGPAPPDAPPPGHPDAPGLPRGASRSPLQAGPATPLLDAPGLARGGSRSSLKGASQSGVAAPVGGSEREPPRGKPGASGRGGEGRGVEANVSLPGASPGHPPPGPPPAEDLLAAARRQADRGDLAEALASCRAHLERAGPSADLYALMGAVHQARREPDEAVRCFQSALYLEPGHVEALAHLMLLYQERGDRQGAALLRRRLERAAAGGEP